MPLIYFALLSFFLSCPRFLVNLGRCLQILFAFWCCSLFFRLTFSFILVSTFQHLIRAALDYLFLVFCWCAFACILANCFPTIVRTVLCLHVNLADLLNCVFFALILLCCCLHCCFLIFNSFFTQAFGLACTSAIPAVEVLVSCTFPTWMFFYRLYIFRRKYNFLLKVYTTALIIIKLTFPSCYLICIPFLHKDWALWPKAWYLFHIKS